MFSEPPDHLLFLLFVRCHKSLLPEIIAHISYISITTVRIVHLPVPDLMENIISKFKRLLRTVSFQQLRNVLIQHSPKSPDIFICISIIYKSASVRILPADLINLMLQAGQCCRTERGILGHEPIIKILVLTYK